MKCLSSLAKISLDHFSLSDTLSSMNSNDAIKFLRDNGYAVVYFEPSELKGADPRKVESALSEFADGIIDFHADKNWNFIGAIAQW